MYVFLSKLTNAPDRKALHVFVLLIVKNDEKYKLCVSARCERQQKGYSSKPQEILFKFLAPICIFCMFLMCLFDPDSLNTFTLVNPGKRRKNWS